MSAPDAHADLCRRFFDAIEAGEVETVAAIYAPDAVIWHNTDGLETGAAENLEVLRGVVRNLADRRYTDRRVVTYAGGFVQQHVLTGRLRNGRELRLPACIVCAVEGGRITRLDEYFDSAALAAVTAQP